MWISFLLLPLKKHKRSKWSSIPLWFLTRARTIKGILNHLSTFTGRLCLLLVPNCWDRSTTFDRAHSKGWWSSGVTRTLQRAAIGKEVQAHRKKYVTYTEGVQREKANGTAALVGILLTKMVITRLMQDKHHRKILECKAKSCQVGREKGKYKKETTKKMQE